MCTCCVKCVVLVDVCWFATDSLLSPHRHTYCFDAINKQYILFYSRVVTLDGTPKQRLSPEAITLWYKPPELLLGAYEYSAAADLWSVGCIFAELLLRRPFLPGKNNSDIAQLDTIFTVFGTPTESNWPDYETLPLCARGLLWDHDTTPIPFDEIFTAAPKDAISLLRSILVLDPNMRFTAEQSLRHPYFCNDPMPTKKENLVLSSK
jgi:cyclin-dependent kinase 7